MNPGTESGPRGVWLLRALVGLGVLASIYYFSWWGAGGRIASPWLACALVLAALYHWAQLFSSWVIYLAARRRPDLASVDEPSGLTVDVFITACGESVELVERSVRAARAMRGEHRTWLLDDGDDPRLALLARRVGARYLTREGRRDAKAGNLNAALKRTDGDVVVIFDVDHVPTPDFLERTLGHFRDPRIGFVQVMLTFRNENQSWFARAASESCLDFFNPTSAGMDGLDSATLIGTNALIRRSALASIGGYQSGLAEDLATSISLHARNWKSVYVAQPLAPGLAPADCRAWFTQQLKWSRGVFEVLLTSYRSLFGRLSWRQRMAYAVRTTYYWIGPVTAIHIGFVTAVLLGGERVARVDLQQYLFHLIPLTLVTLAIRLAAMACWRHRSVRVIPMWRAIVLVHATWPLYTLAWLLALCRLPVRFRPTPKQSVERSGWAWLAPQIVTTVALVTAMVFAIAGGEIGHLPILVGFALVQALPSSIFLWQSCRRTRAASSEAWPEVVQVRQVSHG